MFRVHRAPPRSEWLPTTQLRLSLIENELWLIVRSALKPPSVMFTGRLAADPPEKLKDG